MKRKKYRRKQQDFSSPFGSIQKQGAVFSVTLFSFDLASEGHK